MTDLATAVVESNCVWMVGSGFSKASLLPSVTKLALLMLKNAFLTPVAAGTEEHAVHRWEIIKRVILGNGYRPPTPLPCRVDLTGVLADLAQIEQITDTEQANLPENAWVWKLLNLAQVADVLSRTIPEGRNRELEVARYMGMDEDAVWTRPPSLGHHLMALLMMENAVSCVITTNYDDLIEKAYEALAVPFTVVRNSHEYGRMPKNGGPVIYKIHGCRRWYLETAADQTKQAEAAGALVVTDRQLQGWRDKSWDWARDMVQDKFRTNSFFYLGFSAEDPVLKATLNSVAEEDEAHPSFICKDLSFALFQVLHRSSGFDPVKLNNVLAVPGERLLLDLYPACVAKLIGRLCAQHSKRLGRELDVTKYRCSPGSLLDQAVEAAGKLLSWWAGQVAVQLVALVEPVRGESIRVSPFEYIASKHNPVGTYQALHNANSFPILAKLMELLLAQECTTESDLNTVKAEVEMFGDASAIRLRVGNRSPVRVVLVPGSEFTLPTVSLARALNSFFEVRVRLGLDVGGLAAFLFAGQVDTEQMGTIWDGLNWALPGEKPVARILSQGGFFTSEEGAS